MRTKILFIFAALFSLLDVNGQFSTPGQPKVDIKAIVPRSPQADQLIRVNEISVNTARGVPQISFNLHTAHVGNVEIPISINYDASGIRYDDIPSAVGLKWTLSAGGEVSRNINGREDEIYYFANAYKYSQTIISGWDIFTDSAQLFLTALNNNTYDLSQDEYAYNYLDKSGSFFYKNWKFWDSESPYLTRIETDNWSTLHKFIITDGNGNKAFFGEDAEESSSVVYPGGGYDTPNVPTDGTSTWKINKLKTYTDEEATFEYDTASYQLNKIISQAYVKRQFSPPLSGYACNCGNSTINESAQQGNFLIQLHKKITTPSEEILFFYSRDNSLEIMKNRLDSIVIKDRSQQRIKKFNFHYSYFTGVNYLRLDNVYSMDNNGDSLLVAGFHYTGSVTGVSSMARDIYNYNNGATGNAYLISTSDPDCPYPYGIANRAISSSFIADGTLDSIYYPTGGKAAFFYSPNIQGDTTAPGIKTDSIKYYSNENTLVSSIQYSYNNMQGGFVFNGTVNHTSVEGGDCPVETFHSEYNFNPPIANTFFYERVETRKKGLLTSDHQLTQEYYGVQYNCYTKGYPILEKRIVFRNNNFADTVQSEMYQFAEVSVDSLATDWMYPSYTFLPSQWYSFDGDGVDNTTACNLIHAGVGRYGIMYPKRKLVSSVTTKTHNSMDSIANVMSATSKNYNNSWQLINEKTTKSSGVLDSVVYSYLHSNPGSLGSSVTTNNLYGLVSKTTGFTNSSLQLREGRVHYGSYNGFVLPDSFLNKTYSNDEIVDKIVTAYDTSGNIIEVNSKGLYTSYIRDYNNQLIIAEVVNGQHSNTSYSSFESNGNGGWVFSGSTSVHPSAITGFKGYGLPGGNITRSGLSSGTTYMVTYWKRDSSSTVTVNSNSGTDIFTRNGWKLISHEVTGVTSVTVSGTGYIDELRLYPKGAMMKTYTYRPSVGMTSESDQNNRITYYEYDPFNRLRLIRDQDKNVIRVMDYQYKQTQNQ